MTQLYMSFCDTSLPEGSQFLGAVVLEADDVIEGARKAHELKLNPGGQVLGIVIPDNKIVPKDFCNRLLDAEEAKNLPIEDKEEIDSGFEAFCQKESEL